MIVIEHFTYYYIFIYDANPVLNELGREKNKCKFHENLLYINGTSHKSGYKYVSNVILPLLTDFH